MEGFSTWAGQIWAASQPALLWFGGPFWTFLNAPFIAGLIPALVGLLLSKRVAEVAETNKNVEAVRAAESQVQEMTRELQSLEMRDTVEDAAKTQTTVTPAPTNSAAVAASDALTEDVVAQLEEKIRNIKTEIQHRIRELDGRKSRKYESVPRYDYRPIVLMLARDGGITDEDAYTLVEIFSVWMTHRLEKRMLPQAKADLILGFRFPRRRRRSQPVQASEQQDTSTTPNSDVVEAASP